MTTKFYVVMTNDRDGGPPTKHERLTITLDGANMVIDGPHWMGHGLLVDGLYTGQCHYKKYVDEVARPGQPVYHDMRACPSGYVGRAIFPTGSVEVHWVFCGE